MGSPLDPGEHQPEGQTEGRRAEHPGGRPPELRSVHQGPDHQRDCGHRGQRTGQVEPAGPVARGVLRNHDEGQNQRPDRQRHIDEEHRRPAEVAGEHAAEKHTDHQPGRASRTPNPERAVALGSLRVGRRDDRQGRGEDQCAAQPLDDSGGELCSRTGGQAAGQRGDRVEDQAGGEHPPLAEQIGRAASHEQEPTGRDRVGGHNELQGLSRVAEGSTDVGQRHDDDVLVERDDEHGETHEEQPPRARRSAVGRVVVRRCPGRHVAHPSFGRVRLPTVRSSDLSSAGTARHLPR